MSYKEMLKVLAANESGFLIEMSDTLLNIWTEKPLTDRFNFIYYKYRVAIEAAA